MLFKVTSTLLIQNDIMFPRKHTPKKIIRYLQQKCCFLVSYSRCCFDNFNAKQIQTHKKIERDGKEVGGGVKGGRREDDLRNANITGDVRTKNTHTYQNMNFKIVITYLRILLTIGVLFI